VFLLEAKKEEKHMAKVSTIDLYESCYYLLNSCTLEAIEGIPVNGEITCKLYFNGERITDLQADYFRGTAWVNLFEFRRAYNQINSHVQQTKKKVRAELRQQLQDHKQAAGEGGSL
jgi:hypothetical protein